MNHLFERIRQFSSKTQLHYKLNALTEECVPQIILKAFFLVVLSLAYSSCSNNNSSSESIKGKKTQQEKVIEPVNVLITTPICINTDAYPATPTITIPANKRITGSEGSTSLINKNHS
jgi:hypothetical protein